MSFATESNSERILFPVDIDRCPLDVFPLVNRLACRPGTKLYLLHIITLNILPPESRIYDELAADAKAHLERLCRDHLPSVPAPIIRVRFGKAVNEILAQIKQEQVDAVVLPTRGPSLAERFRHMWKEGPNPTMSRGVNQILNNAECSVMIVGSRVRFNCNREWGRPGSGSVRPCGELPNAAVLDSCDLNTFLTPLRQS